MFPVSASHDIARFCAVPIDRRLAPPSSDTEERRLTSSSSSKTNGVGAIVLVGDNVGATVDGMSELAFSLEVGAKVGKGGDDDDGDDGSVVVGCPNGMGSVVVVGWKRVGAGDGGSVVIVGTLIVVGAIVIVGSVVAVGCSTVGSGDGGPVMAGEFVIEGSVVVVVG